MTTFYLKLISVTAIKSNTSIKELYLGENYLNENDAKQLSSLLKCNKTLHLLDLR